MKKLTLILLGLCAAGAALAEEGKWLTSVPEAVSQATKENKLILMDFTGSDWCGWCQKLDADTFSQPEFLDYAEKNLVLLQLDYPKQKQLPDDLKAQNEAMKNKFGVEGYPTVIVTKADATVLMKQVGYKAGGPPGMIASINEAVSKAGTPAPKSTAPAVAATTNAPQPTPVYSSLTQYVPPKHDPSLQPKLQGILYAGPHSSAVLDGKSCEAGETVDGAKIVKIDRTSVTVEFKGETKVLTMN